MLESVEFHHQKVLGGGTVCAGAFRSNECWEVSFAFAWDAASIVHRELDSKKFRPISVYATKYNCRLCTSGSRVLFKLTRTWEQRGARKSVSP
jgi:hypothetical protein